jgi:transcriptional regulator with XRE-family HTH domain
VLIGDPAQIVGQRLKALRAERGLTTRELAEASDLAFNTISLIERSKMSPTISTLHKLASALGVPLAYFVTESSPKQVVFLKAESRARAHSADVLLENLGTGLPDQTLQPLLLTLQPGADSGPDPIVHVGHELAFCLEGRIEYMVEGTWYELEPEDSLLFEAHLPHCWRNGQSAPSRLLLILQATEGHEAALRRHIESVRRSPRGARRDSGGDETPDREARTS